MTETSVKYEIGTNKGLQLDIPFVSETDQNSLTKTVSEKKQEAIQRYLNHAERETIACVGEYSPGKSNRKYFRLSYRNGRRIKHIHIRGGSTISELAKYRAEKLQEMIDRGAELEEIIAATKTFNSGKK